jgi:hypothetical protein
MCRITRSPVTIEFRTIDQKKTETCASAYLLISFHNNEKDDYLKHIHQHEVWAETQQSEPSNNRYRFGRYQALDEGDWQ